MNARSIANRTLSVLNTPAYLRYRNPLTHATHIDYVIVIGILLLVIFLLGVLIFLNNILNYLTKEDGYSRVVSSKESVTMCSYDLRVDAEKNGQVNLGYQHRDSLIAEL